MSENEFDWICNRVDSNLDSYLMILAEWVSINSYTLNPEGIEKLAESTISSFTNLMPEFRGDIIHSNVKGRGPHVNIRKPGSGDVVLYLVSHLDTVYPIEEEIENNFHYLQREDYIYGPGVIDIKGGTLVALISLAIMRERYPDIYEKANIEILLNGSEELLGSDDFMRIVELSRSRYINKREYCLVYEAQGKDNRLVLGRKGVGQFKATCLGIAGHAGAQHHSSVNSLRIASDLVCQFESMTVYPDLTLNVSVISNSNCVTNKVADATELYFEMRHINLEAFCKVRDLILEFNNYIPQYLNVKRKFIDIEYMHGFDPWTFDVSNELYATFKEALSPYLELNCESRGGGSDANRMSKLMPTIDGLGPRGKNCHSSKMSVIDGEVIAEPEKLEVNSIKNSVAISVLGMCSTIQKNN